MPKSKSKSKSKTKNNIKKNIFKSSHRVRTRTRKNKRNLAKGTFEKYSSKDIHFSVPKSVKIANLQQRISILNDEIGEISKKIEKKQKRLKDELGLFTFSQEELTNKKIKKLEEEITNLKKQFEDKNFQLEKVYIILEIYQELEEDSE